MPKTAKKQDRYASSHKAFERARRVMPGGVNSPVRAYKAVRREPVTIRHGAGCRVWDVDGNHYIDYVMSYGPLILGHAPDRLKAAVIKAVNNGTSFGMPTEAETQLAELVVKLVPSVDVVRMVNSGTEAVMSAIRVARGATGRDKVIKCTGCYHGHSDALLVQAGSGATTLGVPSSPGVPAASTRDTMLVGYNDLAAAQAAFEAQPNNIAAMVIEPVAGNMGCVLPGEGYLQGLRELCDKHGALLIFDEVMTGFRVAIGGAQQRYDVMPDLTCLGKVIGGGMPCAAYGGREELMRHVAPDGAIYQAGTLSGNPVAMAAGLATLEAMQEDGVYEQLEATARTLAEGLREAAAAANVPVQVAQVGSMVCPFFTDKPVQNYDDAVACDTDAFAVFFAAMLDRDVILPPSQFETWFVSTEHDAECIEQTLAAAREAFARVAEHRSPR